MTVGLLMGTLGLLSIVTIWYIFLRKRTDETEQATETATTTTEKQ
jgi:hypothetical protein